MDICFPVLSIVLCWLTNYVDSYHKTNQNRPMGEMKPLPRGVFRLGPPPTRRSSFNHGRVMIFTNPPVRVTPPMRQRPVTSPTTTPRPTTQMPSTTRAFDWNAYFATTYPSTKKGKCPSFDAVHAECYGRCHKDDDCFYERKCCRDGYGFGCCVDPVQPGPFDGFFTEFFGGPTTAGTTGGFFGGGPTTSAFYWKK